MEIKSLINRLLILQKEYDRTLDPGKKIEIKSNAVKLYFLIEEELAKIKYSFRMIDIRNFNDYDKKELLLFPDLLSDIRSLPVPQNHPFSHSSRYQVPLLIYLFSNYSRKLSALMLSASFMDSVKDFLLPGDFQHLRSGGIRFITNTRFASAKLREMALLRNSEKDVYKYWELTLFGILIANLISKDPKSLSAQTGLSRLTPGIRDIIFSHSDRFSNEIEFEKLVRETFTRENAISIILQHKKWFLKFTDELISLLSSPKNRINPDFQERFTKFMLPLEQKLSALRIAEGDLFKTPSDKKLISLMETCFREEE